LEQLGNFPTFFGLILFLLYNKLLFIIFGELFKVLLDFLIKLPAEECSENRIHFSETPILNNGDSLIKLVENGEKFFLILDIIRNILFVLSNHRPEHKLKENKIKHGYKTLVK